MLDSMGQALPPGPHIIVTRDPDVARADLRSLYGDVQGEPTGDFEWRARVTSLGPVTFVQGASRSAFALKGVPEAYILNVVVQNTGRVTLRKEVVDVAAGRGALLLSPGVGGEYRCSPDFRDFTLRFEPAFLAGWLETLTGAVVKDGPVFAQVMPTERGAGAYVERLCHFIYSEIDRGTPSERPGVMLGLVDSLARTLVEGQPHDRAHLVQRPPPPSGRPVVRLVEEYLAAHAGEPIAPTEVVAVAGAPLASIESAFAAHRGTTPAAFLASQRLARSQHAAPVDPALADLVASLSEREREVCAYVARGLLNKQTAAEMSIAERTVKAHRSRAMRKLGVTSVAELAKLWARLGR